MRVAIVTESFLPIINGVSNSLIPVVGHLVRGGHQALVIAPGAGPERYHGVPVVRLPAVDLPVVDSIPVGVPTRKVVTALRGFRPDVVHLASPVIVGALGWWAARRLGVPTVAVYQTDIAAFADSYGLGFAARTAWRWIRRVHSGADRTLAPSTSAAAALVAHGRTGFLLPETGKPDAEATFGDALRRAVLTLAHDSALRTRYGAAARASVRARTWPALCDELFAHYAELTGLPADSRRAA